MFQCNSLIYKPIFWGNFGLELIIPSIPLLKRGKSLADQILWNQIRFLLSLILKPKMNCSILDCTCLPAGRY